MAYSKKTDDEELPPWIQRSLMKDPEYLQMQRAKNEPLPSWLSQGGEQKAEGPAYSPEMNVTDFHERPEGPFMERVPVVQQPNPDGNESDEYMKQFMWRMPGMPEGRMSTEEVLKWPGEAANWTNELLGIQGLDPGRILSAFASGDKEKMGKMISELAEGMANAAVMLAGGFSWTAGSAIGGGLIGSGRLGTWKGMTAPEIQNALKLLKESLPNLTPRQALTQTSVLIPGLRERMGNATWEVVSYPFKKRIIPTGEEGWKSLAEIWQPAVERLEKAGLDKPFRLMMANRSNVSEVGKMFGEITAGMSTKDRLEVIKAFQGLPGTPEVRQLVKSFYQDVLQTSNFDKETVKSFGKVMKKQTQEGLLLTQKELFNMPSAEQFAKTVDASIKGKATPKAIQKALKAVVKDPGTPSEVRRLAADCYNLPYQTPLAAAEAARKSAIDLMVVDLKKSGVIRESLPKGAVAGKDWWVSRFPGLKGAYVPRDVELELRCITDIPKFMHGGFINKLNKIFLSPWKVSKLMLTPPTHFRNMYSNTILNDWGGLPFWRTDVYIRAAKELLKKGKYYREFKKETGFGGTFTLTDVEQVTGGLKLGSNMLDHALAKFDQMTSLGKKAYNAEEQLFKMAKYIHNREKGMATYEAALDAMRWTFNYGEITRATAAVRGSVAPFFTWTSKVLPLMAETAVKHPIRFAKWPMMFSAMHAMSIDQQRLSKDEWSWVKGILPDYVREGAFYMLPWRDAEGRLQLLNMTYVMPGLGDMTDLMKDPAGQLIGSPFLTMTADLLRNTTYSGAPLYYDWEDGKTQWSKMAMYFWRQIAPNFGGVPGSFNWERVYDRVTGTPDAPTWGQIAGSELGLKVVPVDERIMTRRRQAIDDIHRSEIGSQMKSELRKSRGPEETRSIVEHYDRLRRRLEEDIEERREPSVMERLGRRAISEGRELKSKYLP